MTQSRRQKQIGVLAFLFPEFLRSRSRAAGPMLRRETAPLLSERFLTALKELLKGPLYQVNIEEGGYGYSHVISVTCVGAKTPLLTVSIDLLSPKAFQVTVEGVSPAGEDLYTHFSANNHDVVLWLNRLEGVFSPSS